MENQVLTTRLLVVSRESEVLRVVWKSAEPNVWQLMIASGVWDAMEKLQSDLTVDLLLIDLPATDNEELQCLRWLRQLRPELPILIIDRDQETGAKLRSIQVDSQDYLVTPLAVPQLQAAVQRIRIPSRERTETNADPKDLEQAGNNWLFV